MSVITPMMFSGSARALSTAGIGIVTLSQILASDITTFLLFSTCCSCGRGALFLWSWIFSCGEVISETSVKSSTVCYYSVGIASVVDMAFCKSCFENFFRKGSVCTRCDKKFLAPSASDYQGMKIGSLLFKIIRLQGNTLSPSLLELDYPFQKEVFFLVPQVLIHCLYDAFIASKLCSTKVGFQFREQTEVRWSHIRRKWGWGRTSNRHSVAAVMATCDVWAGALSCKSRAPGVNWCTVLHWAS